MSVDTRLGCACIPVFSLGAALIIAGCGDGGTGGRPSGLPGPSGLPPQCGVMNQACLVERNDAPLALGSRTELTVDFQNAGHAGLDISLEAANPDVLLIEGWLVEAVGNGVSGLLVVAPNGAVIDFLHIWVAEAEELRILAWSQTGDLLGRVQPEVTLLVGDEVLVSVEPFQNAQPLLGNFDLQRTIVGDSIAIVPDPVGGLYRVVARGEGPATITFEALGLSTAWQIEVLP